MTDGEFLAEVGTDAEKWATYFLDKFVVRDYPEPSGEFDEMGLMIGWFANAIEAGKASVATLRAEGLLLDPICGHVLPIQGYEDCDLPPQHGGHHVHRPIGWDVNDGLAQENDATYWPERTGE